MPKYLGVISSPGGGSGSERYGSGATAGGAGAAAFGPGTSAEGDASLAIGNQASDGGFQDCIAVGDGATCGANNDGQWGSSGTPIDFQNHGKAGFNGVAPAAKQALIADPTAGATIDAEARTAINAILDIFEAFGQMSTT